MSEKNGLELTLEVVKRIREGKTSAALPDEREALGIPQCPFPCGWENLHTLLVAEGAFLARSLQEDEPITEHQRATVMLVVNYSLEIARAALAATPAADMGNPIAQSNQQVAAQVVLPEPVAMVVVHGRKFENIALDPFFKLAEGSHKLYTEQQVRALLATGGHGLVTHKDELAAQNKESK